MIKLYGVGSAWGLPDFSSFVSKVDCYLRMAQLSYEYLSLNDPSNWRPGLPMPPKGKVPYIEDDGEIIGDSHFIIEHLKTKYGDTLRDGDLTSEENAIALGIRRMVEEHLYWVLVYSRWTDDAAWDDFRSKLFPTLSPAELNARREQTLRDLHGQGLGRHTRSEVYELGNADLLALSAFLGKKHYMLGTRPTTLDATVFAVLATILWPPYESPLKTYAQAMENLEPYCRRMQERYYKKLKE